MGEKFWTRIFDTIKMFPWKSFGLALLIAGCGAAFLAWGQV